MKGDSPDVDKAKSELEQAEKLLDIIQAALPATKVKDRICVAKKHLDHADTQEVLPGLVPIYAGLDDLVSSQSAGGNPMTGFEQMLAEAAPWLLLRAGVSRRRRPTHFDGFFRRYGIRLILFGRFFYGTRQLDGLVAGSARMPSPSFALADMTGTALWVSTWVLALYTFDRHAAPLHQLLTHINPWVAGTALVVLASTLFWLFRRSAPQPRTLHVKQTAPAPTLPPEPRAASDGRPEPTRRTPWTSKHTSNP